MYVNRFRRFFQKNRAKGLQVRVPRGQELSRGQASAEQMPVLSVPEVPASGHGQGGGAHRLAERSPRPFAVQAQVSARVAAQPARVADHSVGPSPRGH